MQIRFTLKGAPGYIHRSERYCRACDQPTDFVLVAEGYRHEYPCCGSQDCQTKVKKQITEALEPL